jgi:hypothetical protein
MWCGVVIVKLLYAHMCLSFYKVHVKIYRLLLSCYGYSGFKGPSGSRGLSGWGWVLISTQIESGARSCFHFGLQGFTQPLTRPVAIPKGHTTVDPIKSCSAWAKWHLS